MNEMEQKWLNRSLELSSLISKCYKELIFLEVNDKKNSSKYNRCFNKLNELVLIEREHYNNRNLNSGNYSNILYNIKDEGLYARISNKLMLNLQSYHNSILVDEHTNFENIKYFLDNTDCDSISSAKNMINHTITIRNYLEQLLVYEQQVKSLEYLKGFSKVTDNKMVKNFYIRSKYEMAQIDEQVERELMYDKFELSGFNALDVEDLKVFFSSSSEEIEIVKDDILKDSITDLVNSLLNIYDYDYDEVDFFMTSLTLRSYLNAAVDLLEVDTLKLLYTSLKEYFSSKSFTKKYNESMISKKVVLSTMKKGIDRLEKKNKRNYQLLERTLC